MKKSDFSDLDEQIAKLAQEIETDTQKSEDCSKEKIYSILKIKEFFKFVFKYIASSAFVFGALLIGTNYSAYTELAKNYVNPDRLENSEKLLYSSILDLNSNNSLVELEDKNSLNKKEENKIIKKEKIKEEDIITISKNKVFHSVDKLASKNSKQDVNIDVDIVPFENRIIIPKI